MSEAMQDLNNFQRLGLKLASQREAAELTVEQLAQLLRVMPRVVTAIEAGDESQLPKRVFILGYINSYIRALELDEGSFADDLAEVFPKPVEMSAAQRIDGGVDKSEVFNDQEDMPNWLKGVLVVSAVLVIAAVLAYLYLRPASTPVTSVQDTDTTEISIDAAVQEANSASASSTVINPVSSANDTTSGPASPEEAQGLEGELAVSEQTPAIAEQVANADQSGSTPNGNVDATSAALSDDVVTVDDAVVDEVAAPEVIRETIVGTSGQRLELNFNAECWVEIKREDGSLLVGDLFNPSRRLIVNTDERVSILLGYGPAASVMFAGEVVEFRVRDNAAAFFYVGE
ncbi:MAG: RodZ domain-containing protein [Pseudomonadales bacterium]|jgi:cytoskeleton protein RodZ